ncbi:MAG: NUDIX domain-containing protein [Alphaproteobacteria bacterium]|jgi:mutator protein MutT|nr:NUDIX domain-containing protein [Alphaproteobacteria bacterium]
MEMLECAGFLLVDGDRFLVERRRLDKAVDPGAVAIPGGHLDAGESPMDALHRELREELGLTAGRVDYICTLLHRSEEFRKLHYYAVRQWTGEIENNEAEALLWLSFDEVGQLDLPVDRTAIAEYLRLYRSD